MSGDAPHAVRAAPRGPRLRRAASRALVVAALAACTTLAPAAMAKERHELHDVRAADALAGSPPSKARDRALARWAEDAPLAEVMYVLRRPSADLAGAESRILKAALKRVPTTRGELRQRLSTRLASVFGRKDSARAPNPNASAFRVVALLPDTGSFADYAQALREGLALGLADGAPVGPSITLESIPSRSESPGRMLAVFDSAAGRAGAIVGELLSAPTAMLATAARYGHVPLVSPTAPDEQIGEIGPAVFQVGPSSRDRAEALVRRVLSDSIRRVGILVSGDLDASPWVDAFAAAAGRSHAEIVWRASYTAGDLDFRDEVHALIDARIDLLFWDGDPREVEALLFQLSRDKVTVRVCGGEGLDPDHHHERARALLEGAFYVSEEWRAGPALAARLDSLAGTDRPQATFVPLRLRGFLVGRAIAGVVTRGALCPEEIGGALAGRTLAESRGGFLDVRAEGVRLPVYRVRLGHANELQ